jgi:hypothetical protein
MQSENEEENGERKRKKQINNRNEDTMKRKKKLGKNVIKSHSFYLACIYMRFFQRTASLL